MPDDAPTAPDSLSFFRRGRDERPQPAPGLEPGKVVGDFELRSLLGQGGMGQVWEARQISLNRAVAVKFVRPERVTEKQLELFAREARAGGRLSHPGIVAVYGHGESDGLAWIAMELVPGAWNLRDFLDEITSTADVPPGYDRKVAEFVARIADAVHAAHEAGVIHRDLKPQNILITEDDRPKVTDFGLARIVDETALSQTGDFAGTYFYMSPEQVAAKRMGLDHRTDVFSLGIVLYEMLALQRPFLGDTEHQVAEQILLHDPPDPRKLRSRVPRDLAVICARCIEKTRERRYRSIGEVGDDIRRWAQDLPIVARPPTPVERSVKWFRRHRTWCVVSGVVGLSLIAILVLFIENARTTDELAHATDRGNRRLEDVLRLSLSSRLATLDAQRAELWPATRAMLVAGEQWLEEVEQLVADLPTHEAYLDDLRSDISWMREEGSLEVEFDEGLGHWERQASTVVGQLRSLEPDLDPEYVSDDRGWSVARRVAFARDLRERTVTGAEARSRWRVAAAEVASLPAYSGLRLVPQEGLLPIGPDPGSGLWEFAYLGTGEVPTRGPAGELELSGRSSLVFVLVPPSLPEGEAGEVFSFFLSKYEMTCAQWEGPLGRRVRHNFEMNLRPTSPIVSVDGAEAVDAMRRLGLRLPSVEELASAARVTAAWVVGPSVPAVARTARAQSVMDLPPDGRGFVALLDHVAEWCAGPGGWRDSIDGMWVWAADRPPDENDLTDSDGPTAVKVGLQFESPIVGIRPALSLSGTQNE